MYDPTVKSLFWSQFRIIVVIIKYDSYTIILTD